MLKWTIFAVVSLGWIAVCYFFGSMVGGTAAGVPAARVQDECAKRVIARAAERGEAIDMMAARFTPECMAIHRATLSELSAPAVREGLLWGVIPVILIGGLMLLRRQA